MAEATEMLIHGIMTPVIQLNATAGEVEEPIRAEIAAIEAEESRDEALEAAEQAAQSATTAAAAAARAEAAIHKPPIIRDGMWWIWSNELGEYESSGVTATGSDADVTTENIKKALGYTPADEAKTVGVEPQVFSDAQKEQARKNIGAVGFGQLPDIVCTAQGEVIALSDASPRELKGLRIFGRTTQDGTPSPDAPVELVSVGGGGSVPASIYGANLVNKNNLSYSPINGGTISVSGEVITASSKAVWGQAESKNVPAVPGATMYLSCKGITGGNNAFIRCCGVDADNIHTNFGSQLSGAGKTVVTVPDNAVKVRVRIYINGTASALDELVEASFDSIMLSYIDTEYVPYQENQTLTLSTPNGLSGISVNSGGNYTDANGQQWICDEVDFARGVLVRRIGIADKDSGWKYYVSGSNDFAYLRPSSVGYSTDDFRVGNNSIYINRANLMCNCLRFGVGGISLTAGTFSITDCIYIKVDGLTSTEEYIGWMEENSFCLLYILAAPIETPLSAEELSAYAALHTNYPNTTVFNDAGAGMGVSYVADTKTYIDNKFAELAAAFVNNA